MEIINSKIQSILKLEGLSLATYVGNVYLLQDIFFTVYPGEFIGIVGASGAGKTSLLRLINRLGEATSGAIFFEGKTIKQIPIQKLRQQIVLVSQEPKLLGMKVEEALAYPLRLRKISSQEISSQVNKWLDKLKINPDWLERNELQLSTGQKQLIAIARGLIIEPKVLLLDEPTSALDIEQTEHLLKVLRELTTEKKTTIIMVNHQLELIKRFCQRILYLKQGKLQQDALSKEVNWLQLEKSLKEAELY
ncbi:MAG: ATP-binding cassette domain-containing protein [Spirulinaceae cyanobacterium]